MKADFVCPKCRGVLLGDGNTKRCPSGHTYDRARAGYYNLLLGSSGGTHGDNATMVEARRKFLSGGYYLPLAERLGELVSRAALECKGYCGTPKLSHDSLSCENEGEADGMTGSKPRGKACMTLKSAPEEKACAEDKGAIIVLDCGCGEGYYTELICSELDRNFGSRGYSMLAFDISREAARYAARRCPGASVAVASCYDIPVLDGSVNIALNVFSPLAPQEVRRTLCDGGKYIVAYPDEYHLFELKERIYKSPYKNKPQGCAPDGFSILSRERVAYEITLDTHEKIASLFMMTPYAYRTGSEERERFEKIDKLTTRVEFLIDIYEKV